MKRQTIVGIIAAVTAMAFIARRTQGNARRDDQAGGNHTRVVLWRGRTTCASVGQTFFKIDQGRLFLTGADAGREDALSTVEAVGSEGNTMNRLATDVVW